MSAPLISVLMPVYDAEPWLAQALDSALAQTVSEFELIIVDDGSTDRSAAIAASYERRDSRVRVIRTIHGGLPRARSISLEEARGRFVAFLDANDEWLPTRLERQLPYANERTVVFSDAYLAEGAIRTSRRYSEVNSAPLLQYPTTGLLPHLLTHGCFVPMLTVLAPRDLLQEAGSFRNAELKGFGETGGSCDFEMWLLLSLRGVQFQYVDEPLAVYRRHQGSLSGDLMNLFVHELRILNSLMGEAHADDRRELRRARHRVRRSIEVMHRKQSWRFALQGDGRAARLELRRSLRARPYSPRAWAALALGICLPVTRRVVGGRV